MTNLPEGLPSKEAIEAAIGEATRRGFEDLIFVSPIVTAALAIDVLPLLERIKELEKSAGEPTYWLERNKILVASLDRLAEEMGKHIVYRSRWEDRADDLENELAEARKLIDKLSRPPALPGEF